MVFEGFPRFYKYFIFPIKKRPLGGVEGRREKVRLCSRLLCSQSRPTPLISAQPLWICGSGICTPACLGSALPAPKDGSARNFCKFCTAWARRGWETARNLGVFQHREGETGRISGRAWLSLGGIGRSQE